jgi:hypothetical protein
MPYGVPYAVTLASVIKFPAESIEATFLPPKAKYILLFVGVTVHIAELVIVVLATDCDGETVYVPTPPEPVRKAVIIVPAVMPVPERV